MNERDSEALLGLFLERGYKSVNSPQDADVILLNTCAVRAHAEHRVRSILGSYKKAFKHTKQSIKSKGSSPAMRHAPCAMPIIGLIGCMARSTGKEIFEKMPYVDLIISTANLHKVPDYVKRIEGHKSGTSGYKPRLRIIDLDDAERKEEFYTAPYRSKLGYAQVVISTGCSNGCSYCVVPYVRGKLRLRKPEEIIAEVKRNVALGNKKITLLGQNVNDYKFRPQTTDHPPQSGKVSPKADRPQTINFVELLGMVEEIDGVEQLDFLTPHPKNTTKELFKLMAKSKKITKYLHLPYQSGSDRILELMHRGYTKKEYLSVVDDYKTIVGGTIGTDIIVGFPTETDEDFSHTRNVLEKVKFMGAYIFKYSPRPGTKAYALKDDVPQKEKERRHKILLDLQKKISAANR
jgi:tRNA-2-methylthio-N6-dimethylallyladenosine synthase